MGHHSLVDHLGLQEVFDKLQEQRWTCNSPNALIMVGLIIIVLGVTAPSSIHFG